LGADFNGGVGLTALGCFGGIFHDEVVSFSRAATLLGFGVGRRLFLAD
jgi:hypothetical protein